MRGRASDTPDTIAHPDDSGPGGLAQARHDVMAMLQRAGDAADPPPAAVVHKLPFAPRDAEVLPRPLEAGTSHGGPPHDALDLLRELARKSTSGDRTGHIEAAPPTAPPWSPAPMATMPTARRITKQQTALFAVVACSAVLAAGLTLFLWSGISAPDSEPRIATSIPVAAPSVPAAAPTERTRPEISSVRAAMAQCDREAAKNPFALYFLVVPVVLGSEARNSSSRSEEDYASFFLMPSTAMLDGLRDGSLTISLTPFRYAILDSVSGKTKAWGATSGVSKFTHDDTGGFSKFKVRIDVSGNDARWSDEYRRRAGECYWVNARLR